MVGPIPAGLPVPRLPDIHPHVLRELLLPAFTVLIVGFSDDVLTARSFAPARREQIHPNRELLALGVANAGSSLLRGFPVSSSATRTPSPCRREPHPAVLAGRGRLGGGRPVVRPAGAGPVPGRRARRDRHLRGHPADRHHRVPAAARLPPQPNSLIALAACVGVLAFNILYGVLVAIGLSVADLLIRVARPHDAILGLVPGLAGMHDMDDYPGAQTIPGLVVYRYDAPLFFANAEDFRRRALAAADRSRARVRWFVLNVEANVEVDFTALEAVDAVREEITRTGDVFALARVKQDLLARLHSFGLADKIGAERLFPTLPTAVEAYRAWAGQHGPQPGGESIGGSWAGASAAGRPADSAAIRPCWSEWERQALPGTEITQLAAAAHPDGWVAAWAAADPHRVIGDAQGDQVVSVEDAEFERAETLRPEWVQPQGIVTEFDACEAPLQQVDRARHGREVDTLGRGAALNIGHIAA